MFNNPLTWGSKSDQLVTTSGLLIILDLTDLFVLGVVALSPELDHMVEIEDDDVPERGEKRP